LNKLQETVGISLSNLKLEAATLEGQIDGDKWSTNPHALESPEDREERIEKEIQSTNSDLMKIETDWLFRMHCRTRLVFAMRRVLVQQRMMRRLRILQDYLTSDTFSSALTPECCSRDEQDLTHAEIPPHILHLLDEMEASDNRIKEQEAENEVISKNDEVVKATLDERRPKKENSDINLQV
jgi:hypothetical protein